MPTEALIELMFIDGKMNRGLAGSVVRLEHLVRALSMDCAHSTLSLNKLNQIPEVSHSF